MDNYMFPISNLFSIFQKEYYSTMNYDKEKMSVSHNKYEYLDMTDYLKINQLLIEVRKFVESPDFCEHFRPSDIKRIDSIEKLILKYQKLHSVNAGRLVWKRLSIIDKKILKVEKELGLFKGNEEEECLTMGMVENNPKNGFVFHSEIAYSLEMMSKLDYLKHLCLLADSHFRIYNTAKDHLVAETEDGNISYLSAITVNLLLSIELGLKTIFAEGKYLYDDRQTLLEEIRKEGHNIAGTFRKIEERYRRRIIEHVCSDVNFTEEWFFSRLQTTSNDMIDTKYFFEEILKSEYGTYRDRISDRFLTSLAEIINEITMQEIIEKLGSTEDLESDGPVLDR